MWVFYLMLLCIRGGLFLSHVGYRNFHFQMVATHFPRDPKEDNETGGREGIFPL